VGRDVTERRRFEEELRKFSRAVEQSPVSVVITNTHGVIEYVNGCFCRVTGYTQEEVLGKNPRILKSEITPPGVYREMWSTILSGGEWRGEFCNKKKSGELFWESAMVSAIRNEEGEITHFLGVKEDITERKKAEKERSLMEMQLLHAQKLESVGQLAAGIAHEINTPIQYVGDNLRFLEESFKQLFVLFQAHGGLLAAARENAVTPEKIKAVEDADRNADFAYLSLEVPTALEQSLDGVHRVANIVRAMKEFSHPGTREKTPVDLNHAIQTTVTVARNEWKYVADVEFDLASDLPMVQCLPDEINQVILNLLVNAAQAIGDVVKKTGNKGVIRVSSRGDGAWVEIRISDTGGGIPPEIQHRIFEPFFTTKDVGKGTGQGLAIARAAIINKHGGAIRFESEPGKGTTFIVRLPVTASNGEKTAGSAI
jgi:PAS domain S-box-containing protein